MDTLVTEIKDFIVSNFLFGQRGDALTEGQSFLETGIIDSTGMLELVSFVEQRYGISIADRELLPENLDSLCNLSQFIARKREMTTAKAEG
jgi:acyl carrier protein